MSNLDSTVSQVQSSLRDFVRQQVQAARSYRDQLSQYSDFFSQVSGDSRLSSSLRSSLNNLASKISDEIARAKSYISGNTDGGGNPITGYENGLSGPSFGQAQRFTPNDGLLSEIESVAEQVQNELSQAGGSAPPSPGAGSDEPSSASTEQSTRAGFNISLGSLTPVLIGGGILYLAMKTGG